MQAQLPGFAHPAPDPIFPLFSLHLFLFCPSWSFLFRSLGSSVYPTMIFAQSPNTLPLACRNKSFRHLGFDLLSQHGIQEKESLGTLVSFTPSSSCGLRSSQYSILHIHILDYCCFSAWCCSLKLSELVWDFMHRFCLLCCVAVLRLTPSQESCTTRTKRSRQLWRQINYRGRALQSHWSNHAQ